MIVNKKDIIISDPCYLKHKTDWEITEIDKPLSDNINVSTLYGDWSCTTFRTRNADIKNMDDLKSYVKDVANCDKNNANDEIIGNFCADSGMVCVTYRDEVMKYNPNFEINECYIHSFYSEDGIFTPGEKIKESIYNRLATLIQDFNGEVDIFDFDIDDTTHRVICGFGNINFYTLQTGY
jgi:hypothetical protein